MVDDAPVHIDIEGGPFRSRVIDCKSNRYIYPEIYILCVYLLFCVYEREIKGSGRHDTFRQAEQSLQRYRRRRRGGGDLAGRNSLTHNVTRTIPPSYSYRKGRDVSKGIGYIQQAGREKRKKKEMTWERL